MVKKNIKTLKKLPALIAIRISGY